MLLDLSSLHRLVIGSDVETAPKGARRDEIVVLNEDELAEQLNGLRGHWLYVPALISAASGLRRGEVLGLRWRDIDTTKCTLSVQQQVKKVRGAIIIEPPKTERSRRTTKIPANVIAELETHRKNQLEQRLKLGLGGRPDLVFTSPLGGVIDPDYLSETFARKATKPGFTFHGLRHTHITLLLRAGVPVHIVSA